MNRLDAMQLQSRALDWPEGQDGRLWWLALSVYGDADRAIDIAQLNSLQDPFDVAADQTLLLPTSFDQKPIRLPSYGEPASKPKAGPQVQKMRDLLIFQS